MQARSRGSKHQESKRVMESCSLSNGPTWSSGRNATNSGEMDPRLCGVLRNVTVKGIRPACKAKFGLGKGPLPYPRIHLGIVRHEGQGVAKQDSFDAT